MSFMGIASAWLGGAGIMIALDYLANEKWIRGGIVGGVAVFNTLAAFMGLYS
jgi:hypothetical protein